MTSLTGEDWFPLLLLVLFLTGLFLGSRLPAAAVRRPSKEKDPRQSPDYIEGMHAMLTGDADRAIDCLSRVVELSTEPVEVYLALGYLYRQRGQVERAIRVHQSLLMRADLREEERVLALNALGADFKTGGLMDRALKAFRDALALHPKDSFALSQLVKLSEDLSEWEQAYEYALRLQKVGRHRDPRALSYLLTQKAQALAEGGNHFRAAWLFRRAIRLLPENMLAYIFLVKLHLKRGKAARGRRILERAVREMPYKSYMVLPLLKELYQGTGDVEGYLKLLHGLGREHHQKRALLQYLEEIIALKRSGQLPTVVRDLVRHFGRSRLVQRTVWELVRNGALPAESLREAAADLSQGDQMADPYTCIYCGYKTLEILHRCPNCKEWNSFSDGEG